jgi:hypothetical protein
VALRLGLAPPPASTRPDTPPSALALSLGLAPPPAPLEPDSSSRSREIPPTSYRDRGGGGGGHALAGGAWISSPPTSVFFCKSLVRPLSGGRS